MIICHDATGWWTFSRCVTAALRPSASQCKYAGSLRRHVIPRARRPVQLLRQCPPLPRIRVFDEQYILGGPLDDDLVTRLDARGFLAVARERRPAVDALGGHQHLVL